MEPYDFLFNFIMTAFEDNQNKLGEPLEPTAEPAEEEVDPNQTDDDGDGYSSKRRL